MFSASSRVDHAARYTPQALALRRTMWYLRIMGSANCGASCLRARTEGPLGSSLMNEVKSIINLILLQMEQCPPREQEKLTITELQRYLPLRPPPGSPDFPENIKRYLGSSSFNNFSLKEQAKIRESLKVAYRNYFPLGEIVGHLSELTSHRFTKESIEQALCNCAFRYELIDWFLFVRIVSSGEKQHPRPERQDAAVLIQRQYRLFLGKKRILNGRQAVETLKRSMEERLIREFAKEALAEIKEIVDRSRVQMEQRFYSQTVEQKVNYVHLEKLINGVLECSLDPKKVKYLYLKYDYANVGWFQLKRFTSEIFTEQKIVSVPKQLDFLRGVDEMMEFVRKYTKQIYYSAQELLNAYLENYHGKTMEGEADELHPYELYLFLRDKCENKLSYLQATAIHAQVRFVNQVTVLFERKSALDLSSLVEKLLIKKERRRQLKKENEVFYSFRRIILILISKSKAQKLTRAQFNALVTSYDPSLKYDAFYCVWRVYGGLINLERMRKECALNPLACFFKASASDDEYDRIVERLMDEYPEGTEVSYSKVEERINLQCEFVLETQQIKPLPLGDYDVVQYRKCIMQILPLDFEIIMRAYIFRKVSEKFIAIWRGIKLKKQEKLNRDFLESILSQTLEKEKKEKEQPKDKIAHRKLINNRSVASLASRTSAKSKKQINHEHVDISRAILEDIIDGIKIPESKDTQLEGADCIKQEIALACKESYTFRSILTRACFHPLIGGVARGKEFLQLREGVQSHLDIKIPYKPDVEVIDFAIWNNSLAVFTSYNTLELYSLAQTSNYPFRSIQFPMAPLPVENALFDRACTNRFHGKYPAVVKASRNLLLVSLVHSREVWYVDEDPLIALHKNQLSFGDHFYPKQLLRWFSVLKKGAVSESNRFVEGMVAITGKFKQAGFCSECQQELATLINSCGVKEEVWAFQLREVFNFCCEHSGQVLKAMLRRECGRQEKLALPSQLAAIVKLVLEYMRENNYSLHEMIQEITYQGEEVGLREFKNYLMRVAYEQFLQFEKEIDRYLRTLTRSKTIDYAMLADLLGQGWPHSLMEKPFFVLNDLALLPEFTLLLYTLNGSPAIYARNSRTGLLIAKLSAHKSTPVFHLVPEALLLVSADAVKPQGETVDLLVWRLQEDLIDRFSIRPPWIISPFYRLRQAHDQPITSLTYLPRSHTIVSSSLDSTLKLWTIQQPFSLCELRRVYSGEHLYLSAQGSSFTLEEGISMEYLLTVKINKQISTNNVYRYEPTVEVFIVETVRARAASLCRHVETPLRVQQAMVRQGEVAAVRKKVLLAKTNHQQIQSLTRATLMLESLDRNIYNSLKNAYIFGSLRQLTLLTHFLNRSEHAEMVVRKVCEDYGLNLLTGTLAASPLELPPNLSTLQNSTAQQQIEFSIDVFEEIMEKVVKNSTNNETLIDGETLRRLMAPYLYGDNQGKLNEILVQSGYQKNKKLIQIGKFKQFVKTFNVEGQIPKFLSCVRSLLQFLKERRIKVWELFSVSKQELERCKKVRKADFSRFLEQAGFNRLKLDSITSFLNRNGTISLFEFLHYVRVALEDSHHSALMPNYSSLLMTHSHLQLSHVAVERERQEAQEVHESSLSKSCLQQEIQEMMNRKSSRLSAISESEERERANSAERPRGSGEEEGRGMLNSTSRGSLSRDITYTKDTIKREAMGIMRNLQELMRNEAKSMWELLALATPDFLSSPLISETEYFAIFDYLKTPFLLREKLQLLKYIRREASGTIDLNVLFELTETATAKSKFQGEKYLVSYILEKLEELSPALEQAIEAAFFLQRGEKEVGVDALTLALSQPPFNCSHFALKEFEQLLLEEKKLHFAVADLRGLFAGIIEKHQLKVTFNKLNFLGELRFRIDKKGELLREIFPKGTVDLPYFIDHAAKLHPEPAHLERDFQNITSGSGKHRAIKWEDFIRELEKRLGRFSEENNRELEAARKFVKQLETQRMTVLEFFLGLDRSRKFYVTQEQLQAGLAELNVDYDLWPNIARRHAKRLAYFELVRFLQDNRIINYKTVDSEVELAMEKFTRRYLRSEDIEVAFNRIKGDPHKPQLLYEDFRTALKMVSYFNEEEIILLFGLLAREGVVKESRDGNDELLRDPSNLRLGVGFKRFSDVIGVYRTDNITKTVAFRFYDYLKKRNISLLFEYRKWMERNKKNKEVAEALKNDKAKLTKDTFLLFLAEIKGGLGEKEQKELLARQPAEIDFQAFLGDLETTYKKGTLDLEREEAEHYLRELLRRVGEMDVSLDRLFQDFSQRGSLSLAQLNDLCGYVQLGLNKIQLKKLFNYLDRGKQGAIVLGELMEAAESMRQEMERDSEDYRFDYIIEKLTLNPQKFVLKSSRVAFSLDRARIIFNSLLSSEETDKLYQECLRDLRRENVNEQEMEEFIKRKSFELRMRFDRKDRELIAKVLSFLKRVGIEIEEAFSYLARHSSREELRKQDFVLLLQTLDLRCDLAAINSLFAHLEEGRRGVVSRAKWEEKLQLVQLEQEIQTGVQSEDLRLFYKVKLFLAEVYLVFVRKSYKQHQIFHFFDRHSNGRLAPDELLRSLAELGAAPEDDFGRKIINYLDRNRENSIQVAFVVQELEQCLSSKMRLVLHTKTSRLFQEKARLFQEKAAYFIKELSDREELVEVNGAVKSCLLEYKFIDLMRDFGCPLTADEAQDVRQNFCATEGYLFLYPIYMAFASLFREGGSELGAGEAERLRRLFLGMIRHNYSLQQLQRFNTHQQLYNFIEQVAPFTPVDIRLIIASCAYEGSNSIDVQLLKHKIRNVYLSQENEAISESFVAFAGNTHEDALQELRQKIDLKHFRQVLGSSKGLIDLPTFEGVLQKMGVGLTKGVARRYFELFSEGKERLEVGRLLEGEEGDGEAKKTMFKSFLTSKSEESNELDKYQYLSSPDVLISEHIAKCLAFKESSLNRELAQDYLLNFGFVGHAHILLFLQRIGVDTEKCKEEIAQFLEKYSFIFNHVSYRKEELIRVQQLHSMIADACRDYVSLPDDDKLTEQPIQSQQITLWMAETAIDEKEVSDWIKEEENGEFTHQQLFRFLCKKQGGRSIVIEQFVRTVPAFIDSYDLFLTWYCGRRDTISANRQEQAEEEKSTSDESKDYFSMFMSRNPIRHYEEAIDRFCSIKLQSNPNSNNLERLSAILIYEHILTHQHVFQVNPNLLAPTPETSPPELKITINEINLPVKTLANLTIDEEREIDPCGLLLINEKYYGFGVGMRQEFENMATVACTLDPSVNFLKTKNFYLWEPNSEPMPKGGLHYRWSFIPSFGRWLLTQFSKAHEAGFCLPHLRWKQMNRNRGIEKALYPCAIDRKGVFREKLGWKSLNFEDPYCCPEFYRTEEGLTYRCDSWVFGCLLYEFIYSHPPQAFLVQLQRYAKECQQKFSIADLLEMEELPSGFTYTFYDEDRIRQNFSLEHELKPNSTIENLKEAVKREQSLRGLLRSLEISFGEEYRYFKEEFELMEQLNCVIYDCLNPNPHERPTIESLLTRKVFAETPSMEPYKNLLLSHVDARNFYVSIIQPVTSLLIASPSKAIVSTILRSLKQLQVGVELLINCRQISSQFVIPKYYPWPSSAQGPYSSNILEHKQAIRRTSNFNILTLLYNSSYFQTVLFLLLLDGSPQTYEPLEVLIEILARLLLTFKQYNSASCGFVEVFIDTLLKILYDQPLTVLGRNWVQDVELLEKDREHLGRVKRRHNAATYLRAHHFNSKHCQRALRMLEEVCYLTGEGNIEYLPIRHFLMENSEAQSLLEMVYCHVKLVSGREDVMMINYFRDRLEDEFRFSLQLRLKVEVDLLRFLTCRSEAKTNTLTFLRDALSLYPNKIALVKHSLFYAHLASLLRDSLQILPNKCVALEVVCLVMSDPQIRKKLCEPSSNLVGEVVRLMIEPAKTHASHEEYVNLKPFLWMVGKVLEEQGSGMLQGVDGGQAVLQAFLLKEEPRLQLSSQSNIKHD